jgi:hypothetical protein
MSNEKPNKQNNKMPAESKIHEPLSSYYPPPFKVDHPTQQNKAPEYYGHGAVYVGKDEAEK